MSINDLSDLSVGDSVVFQQSFSRDRPARICKVTDKFLYVLLGNPETGIDYCSCVKFRRSDGMAFRDRKPNQKYRLRRVEKAGVK